MDRAGFLDALAADSKLLADAAARDLTAAVPHCAGWTVRDVVEHVAAVYEHKLAAIERGGAKPDPWPPSWPEDRDPLDWFADVRGRLLDTLRRTDPASPSWTWWPPDQTTGFWVRRMAQETAVHRVDVEAVTGTVGPIDADLAADGIDEVLELMLAGDWSDFPQPDLTGTVQVATAARSWRIAMAPTAVVVAAGVAAAVAADGDDDLADATVTGEASPLLLWLWGRADDSLVEVTGDPDAAARLRRRLALATQ